MEASQSIQLKTEQKLVISQRLQQQLAILHMTLQEVAALANEQLQSNPMLEVAEGAEAADSPFSDLSLDALEGTLARSESFDDGALPVSSGATFYRAGQSGEAPADFLRYTYKPESLEDYLAFQLADYPLSEAQKQICRHLIAMLDEHGFFREPLADAAQLLGTDEFELTQMLYVIQSLDPPGIGARDLQECLILQLAAGDCFNGYTVRIVKEGLELLSQNRIGAIAKLLGVDTAQAKACCDAVRALSPIPTRGFYTGEDSAYVVPDAVVIRQGAELFVQMNDSMIPHLVVNRDYEALLAESRIDVNSGNVRKSTHSETQAETAPDTDADGNLLLTTDENRLVYQTEYGCEVLVFNGTYVSKIYLVYTFASADDASQYLNSNANEIMSAGDVMDIKQQDNMLILSAKMAAQKYIKYLSMTREQVEEEFASFKKQ